MRTQLTRIWRGLAIAGAMFAGFRMAAEPAPVAASDSGLSNAKRDYKAIEASREEVPAPALELPESPALELKTDEVPPANPVRRSRRERQRELELVREREKSHNWLLESMAELEKSDDKSRAGLRAGTEPKVAPADAADATSESSLFKLAEETPARSQDAETIEERIRIAGVVNPLDRYMAAWMRPADFELLAANRDGVSAGSPAEPRQTRPRPAAEPFGGPGPRAGPGGGDDLFRAPEENPFLSGLALPSAVTGSAGFVPVIDRMRMRPAPAALVPVPEPAARAEPSLREQLKGPNDGKHFRQLKRF